RVHRNAGRAALRDRRRLPRSVRKRDPAHPGGDELQRLMSTRGGRSGRPSHPPAFSSASLAAFSAALIWFCAALLALRSSFFSCRWSFRRCALETFFFCSCRWILCTWRCAFAAAGLAPP